MIWKELKLVPGFKINPYGEILWEGKLRAQYLNEDGYLRSSVKVLGKGWITIPIQRLSAAAFIDETYLLDSKMHVNHRDLDKFNNHYTNLEWLTAEENNLHAALFKLYSERETLKLTESSGKILFFKTVYECAEYLNIDPLDVWDAIRFMDKIKGSEISYIKSIGKKPVELHSKNRPSIEIETGRYKERAIKIRDITNGEIKTFVSLSECARITGIKKSSLALSLSKEGKISLIRRRFQVSYLENDFITVGRSATHLRGRLSVTTFNLNTGMEKEYLSAALFYKENGLSKKSVTVTLAKRNIRQVGDYLFCYTDETELLKEIKMYVSAL